MKKSLLALSLILSTSAFAKYDIDYNDYKNVNFGDRQTQYTILSFVDKLEKNEALFYSEYKKINNTFMADYDKISRRIYTRKENRSPKEEIEVMKKYAKFFNPKRQKEFINFNAKHLKNDEMAIIQLHKDLQKVRFDKEDLTAVSKKFEALKRNFMYSKQDLSGRITMTSSSCFLKSEYFEKNEDERKSNMSALRTFDYENCKYIYETSLKVYDSRRRDLHRGLNDFYHILKLQRVKNHNQKRIEAKVEWIKSYQEK